MATEPKWMDAEETSALAILLEPLKRQVQVLQDYSYLAARAIASLFSPPLYVNDLLQQMDIIGIGSLPIVLLTGAFIGAVMTLSGHASAPVDSAASHLSSNFAVHLL